MRYHKHILIPLVMITTALYGLIIVVAICIWTPQTAWRYFMLTCKLVHSGFLWKKMKKDVFDPVLNSDIISVTSCNLDDATILRPANSWIFATKYDNT